MAIQKGGNQTRDLVLSGITKLMVAGLLTAIIIMILAMAGVV